MVKQRQDEPKKANAPKAFRQEVANGVFRHWKNPSESSRCTLRGLLKGAYICGFWPITMCDTIDVCMEKDLGFFDVDETLKWLEGLEKTAARGAGDFCRKTVSRRKKSKDDRFQIDHKCFGFRKVLQSFEGEKCVTVPWRRLTWSLDRKSISADDKKLELTPDDILAEDWSPVF